jgi:hypothetical protein
VAKLRPATRASAPARTDTGVRDTFEDPPVIGDLLAERDSKVRGRRRRAPTPSLFAGLEAI